MQFETIASGFYLEALAIGDDAVWYSDVARGGIHRLAADGRVETWFPDKIFIAALQLNHDGCVLFTGAHGIAWLDPVSGASGSLLDTIDGAPVPGVNEMTPDGEGGVYFGVIDLVSIAKGEPPKPSSLYRLHANGTLVKLCDGLKFSNGLGLSADRRRLYHNESFHAVFRYDVAADGSLGAGTKLQDKPDCDGMALDQEGAAWVTGFSSSELIRFLPNGGTQVFSGPGEAATNIRFGGADGRDLYVHTVTQEAANGLKVGIMPSKLTSHLHRARVDTPGRVIKPTRFKLR